MTERLKLNNWPAWRILLASAAVQNLAYMSALLKPVVVDELIRNNGLSAGEVGALATAEVLSVSFTMILAVRWRHSVHYLLTTLIGLLVTCAATLGCLYASGFVAFLVLRVFAGFGFGLLMLVPGMALARFEKADVMFGRTYAANLICTAAIMFLMPQIAALAGRPPAFPTYFVMVLFMLPFALMMPAKTHSPPPPPKTRSGSALGEKAGAIYLLAAGAAAFGLCYGLVWTFFMSLGQETGMTVEQAGTALSLSLLGGLLASLLTSKTHPLIQSLGAFRVNVVASAGSLILLLIAPSAMVFVASGIVGMFGMYFFFPALLGAAARYDSTGRGVAVINSSLGLAGAFGPMLAGLLIQTGGKSAVIVVTVCAATAAMILFEIVWRGDSAARMPQVSLAE